MSVANLLQRLRQLDVRVWLDGDRLRVNAPPGVLTPELRDELASAKPGLIDLLATSVDDADPILAVDHDAPLPLSFAQERMWLLHQMDPAGAAYHVVKADRWNGDLDSARLERAWHTVVRRHELLRARIVADDGVPRLTIDNDPASAFGFRDVSAEGTDAEAAAAAIIDAEAHKSFDLAEGPLASLLLIRVGTDRHVVVLRFHHAVVDQWALGIVDHELRLTYASDGAAPLPMPAVSYVDFAAWQRQRLSGARWDRLIGYWRARLDDAEPMALPPVPAGFEEEDGQVAETVAASLIERTSALATSSGATLYMTLLAAFAALLFRHTGRTDIPIATPVAGRQRKELEGVVGVFINTLVVRVDVRAHDTFRDLIARVRDAVLDAFAHQEAPFERLVQELAPRRTGGSAPLAHVMFNLLNQPAPAHAISGISTEAIGLRRRASALDLSLIVDPHDRSAMVEYRGSILTRAGAHRFVDQYLRLLDAWAADPALSVADLPVLHPREFELLREWNATSMVYDPDEGIERLIAAHARRTPDIAAVVAVDTTLTYADLEGRSGRLAAILRDEGVGPNVLVGVCLERTSAMITAVLGILKAGGAFLPLDPAFPPDRLAWMVEDSGIALVLTDAASEHVLPSSGPRHVRVDAPRFLERIAAASVAPLAESAATGAHLAYVLYTSGSTGKPKGVEIPRRALANFLRSMAARPGFGADDVLLAVTTLSFDIAGLELLLPLISGGRVELATRDEALDGRRLLDRIQTRGVTVLQATPATWRLLLDSGWARTPALRAFCGGEPLPRPLADQLLDRCAEVWNLYGPTETTIWSTVDRVTAGTAPVMIGTPIANTQVHVLDAAGALASIGMAGELCIGGDGVALGYRGRPELTAERFVPNRFTDRAGARMYRTGDLARWYADGRLECLGRLDHQVKVRGFRIELGEIEAVLGRHPDVRQAVVVVFGDPADARLAAYVVPHDDHAPDNQALRAFLRESLPEYMVPSVFVPMAVLPLTANGKIDRKALPPPTVATVGEEGGPGPATDMEQRIASIWSEILGVSEVPVDKTFFDLGGHSLLVARVRGRLEQQLMRSIAMADLFEYPTVRTLAAHLERHGQEPVSDAPVAVRRVERRRVRNVG